MSQEPPSVSTTPAAPASLANDKDAVIVTADGDNTYVGSIATADENVVIHYHETIVYCDHAIFDRDTRVLTCSGHVRIFDGSQTYRGEHLIYNLDTKAITSTDFLSSEYPRFMGGKTISTPEFNHYHLTESTFTTSDRQHPSFYLKAKTMEYRPHEDVVMKNILLYVGNIPILYIPIYAQSLVDKRPAYQFQIGKSGQYGYFLKNQFNWTDNSNLRGTVHVDLRSTRGFAGGADVQYYPSTQSSILFKSYFAKDNLYALKDPNYPGGHFYGNSSDGNVRDGIGSDNRYRVMYEQHLQFGPDIYSIANLNLWSDPWVTHDFFQSEYQASVQPEQTLAITQYNPNFSINAQADPQVNSFFDAVERLPEVDFDVKQQKIFHSPIEYHSENSLVVFRRTFANLQDFRNPGQYPYAAFNSTNPFNQNIYGTGSGPAFLNNQQSDYSAYRYDTYHEFSYPHQYFNFLSVTPHVGGRFTYYSDSNYDLYDTKNNTGLSPDKVTNPKGRIAGDIGLDADFKISQVWQDLKVAALGINGLRHVIEPFLSAQYAPTPNIPSNQIRGFDNRLPSTVLQPINYPFYNSIDSIDKQAIVRYGVDNKLETKRDGKDYQLFDLTTEMDADLDRNFSSASTFSNLFNTLTYYPTEWLTFSSSSSIDIDAPRSQSYDQFQNSVQWQPLSALRLTATQSYINHSPYFTDGNQVSLDAFYRMNEHWQVEGDEQFDIQSGKLQLSQYTVYRDLESWQLAATYSNALINSGQMDNQVYFTLTLKAFPEFNLHEAAQ